MTVARLEKEMTCYELEEWKAYMTIEARRADTKEVVRSAQEGLIARRAARRGTRTKANTATEQAS